MKITCLTPRRLPGKCWDTVYGQSLEKGQQFDGDLAGDTYDNDKIKTLQAEKAAKTIRDDRFQMLMGALLGVTCPETHRISGLGLSALSAVSENRGRPGH